MYLLEAGASVDLNLSTIPFPNLIATYILVMLLFVAILFVIVRYVRKIGSVELDKENSIESFAYEMNRSIAKVDDDIRMRARTITASLKTRLRNIFYESGMCPVAVIALTNSALGPLYDSAANNHFTSVLMPEHRDNYLNKMLKAIEDEYRSTYNALLNFECGVKLGAMPSWETKAENGITPRERVQNFLSDWVNDVMTETIKSCIKKIEIYKSYEETFKGDKHWSGILEICISKNEKYISFLDRHGKGWQ